ncbi:hypothetical protein BBO_08124 [Beauveria brongniartii RCEF 3172]|uniref:Uncharacterized protein n=1 Tax=Beauveria brongniartii RCEF 3172 TaxID=1081107 RepID=A0A166Y5J3_9HYPO|nr:hypothetical protein BBO_08124 [Beauveria brongniartii RCEF 3172]
MLRRIVMRWHSFLGLARQRPSWYRDRLREELQERREAVTLLQKLSETADVFYILSRATHDGYPLQSVPPLRSMRHMLIYAYMILKYTSRCLFYRVAAMASRSANASEVREVINPAKKKKIGEVASRHGLDPVEFERVCSRLRRFWPLFP